MNETLQELDDNRRAVQKALAAWYLTGATAVGKTAVSLQLAHLLDAEIISLDSMSVYRGMDLGTAKPSLSDRSEVRHHLIDICDPQESFSVSRYRELALQAIDDIQARGKTVLFVGGSALYLKAMLRGLFRGPPADWTFRREVEREVEQVGSEALHRRLREVDPVAAHKLHVNDRRRMIRALEVFHLTGKPISHWQMEFDFEHAADQCRVFTLRRPRSELHRRIEERVHRMFQGGFVDEVQRLLQGDRQLSLTARQAVGYQEIIEMLGQGGDLAAAMERVLIRTRRFARHQETWFRGLSECRMLELAAPHDNPAEIAAQIRQIGDSVDRRSHA